MHWFKQNPFLAALISAVLVVLVAGGFSVFSEAGRLEEEQASFDQKSMQLQKLRSNKPFPDKANVDATTREVDEARATLDGLAKGLAVSVPQASPQSFQDQLAKVVKDLVEKASAKNVTLPDKFYLGFEKYEAQLPSAEVAPKLALQLLTINAVVSILLDAQVKSIGPVVRAPVKGEDPAAGEQPEQDKRKVKNDGPNLEIAPFDISFVSDQPAFRMAFNRIVEIEPPVFVRLVAIENSAPAPPSKNAEPAASTETPQSPQDSAAAAQAGGIKPVVGRETLTVHLRLASVVLSGQTTSTDH